MNDVGWIRPNLKSAISWAIVAEIIRRHGDSQSLRVLQTHPGGGQYDCLSLYRLRDCDADIYAPGNATELGALNRQSGNFRAWVGPSKHSYPWLAEWLTAPDPTTVVDRICDLLGLAPVSKVPETSRQTFGIRLISAFTGARMMQLDYLDASMGYVDSSGIAGSGHDKSLGDFTALFAGETGRWETGASQAAKCWLLFKGNQQKLVGVLRSDGRLSAAADCQRAHDLYQAYLAKRQMEPVLFEALALLSS